MAAEYPLSLVIKAIDRATGPLREVNAKIQAATAPVRRLNNAFRALSAEAGLPRLTKAVGTLGSELWSLGKRAALVGAGAAYGLYRIARGAMEAGDQLGKMAERVGLSVDAYAQLRFAAAQADVEQEEFNGAMDQFNKRLGEAKAGGGPLLAFLQKVAPRLALQVKGAKSTEEALGLMTDAFEKVEDPGKRAALSAAAFGKSGLQMGVWLHQGRRALGAQREEYARLAGSQQEFADGADRVDQAVRRTETAFEGLRNRAFGKLAPAMERLANALTGLIEKNGDRFIAWAERAGAAISKWVDSGGLDRVIEGLANLKWIFGAIAAGTALSWLHGVGSALWAIGSAALPIVARAAVLLWPLLGKLAMAFMSLNLAVAGPFVAALLGVAAAGYAIWKNWSEITEIFTTWQGLLNAIRAEVDLILHPLQSLGVAWDWWKKALGFGGPAAPAAGPALGAAAVAPAVVGAPGAGGSAALKVDFTNLPKGVRVTPDPGNTADLDLSLGYSMGGT